MDDVRIWVQNEIKSLLFEYLTNVENGTAMNTYMLSIKDVIKDKTKKSMPSEMLKKVRLHFH
jgi:hypothetical protein